MRQCDEAAAERGQGPAERRVADDDREFAVCHKLLESVFFGEGGIAGLAGSRFLPEEGRAGDGAALSALAKRIAQGIGQDLLMDNQQAFFLTVLAAKRHFAAVS